MMSMVRCGKKITRDNLCVRSLTTTFELQKAKPVRLIAESFHAIVPWMFEVVLVAINVDPTAPVYSLERAGH